MGIEGKSGCGCLIFVLVICLVLVGVLMHPFSLKFIAKQMRFADSIGPADVIFVHRCTEDTRGELYTEAFRDYWAGNGKMIYIEEDKILGISLRELVEKMGQSRGIKEQAVRAVETEGDLGARVKKVKERMQSMGYKKVIVLVPEYASKRYRFFYGSVDKEGNTLFMIKPVEVSYFKTDKWWKDPRSRTLMYKEVYDRIDLWVSRIKGIPAKK